MELLLDGEEESKLANSQISYLTIAHYHYTGVGVFISFSHEVGAQTFKVPTLNLILNGVEIQSIDLAIGANATLFFTDGIIDFLEIWSFDGNYPKKELESYTLTQNWEGSSKKSITVY